MSFLKVIIFFLGIPSLLAEELLFSDGFDNDDFRAIGISSAYTGGNQTTAGQTGGPTDSQGFDALPSFSDLFWRVTTENDVLELTISNITSSHSNVSVAFSLGMMDSWDGTSGTYGSDIFNFEVTDGTTTLVSLSEPYSGGVAPSQGVVATEANRVQLGFNNGGQVWWNDDAYRLEFNNLAHTSDTLVLRFWASSGGSGEGFQGGNDESFAVDNIRVTYDAVPEPSASFLFLIASCSLMRRGKRV
ncbi:hypothetical protein [Roseibacillus persicicus]|uniref:hypothetical protein n=1 Tax=Roseibacillus persicicus TaxID=454148 RepID=UPI00280F581B|nr:hypothetical protein [Roseibacillus persicicus]MDQ8190487.1 hypothetical protein [Roseibacillus persicicus]